jgi:hypothetical protein
MKVAGNRSRRVGPDDPDQTSSDLPPKINKKTEVSPSKEVVPPKKAVPATAKKKKAVRKRVTSPEDAILRSSAVDPDLEKAAIPKKSTTKKARPKKSAVKKAVAEKKPPKKPSSKKSKS